MQLYGPTLFAPVIQHVARFAKQGNTQEQQKYYVLLIITDGAICDMAETKAAIVNASALPMSM